MDDALYCLSALASSKNYSALKIIMDYMENKNGWLRRTYSLPCQTNLNSYARVFWFVKLLLENKNSLKKIAFGFLSIVQNLKKKNYPSIVEQITKTGNDCAFSMLLRFIQYSFFLGIVSLNFACSKINTSPPAGIQLPWRVPPVGDDVHHRIKSQEVADRKSSDNKKLETSYFGNVKTYRPASKDTNAHASLHKEVGTDIQFRDADIHGVIDAILGDALKLNYTIDPSIQGKITVRTRTPLSKDALLPALEAALLSVSATIVQQGGMYQVIPLDLAPQRVRGVSRLKPNSPMVPGFGIDILPLRYINVREMQNIIDTVFPKGTVLRADETYNNLVISGISQDRTAVQQLVESFDVDWLQGMNFALYHVEYSSPHQLITELKEIFQSPINVVGSRVRFVTLDRIHAILGISKDRSDLELIESWIKRLDVAKSEEQRVFVYNVQSGDSKQLAAALRQLLGGEIGGGEQGSSGLLSKANSDVLGVQGIQGQEGQQNAAGEMDNYGKQSSSDGQSSNQGTRHSSKLVSNDETNSLLYYGTEGEYRVISDALRQLDVIPRQVMIEAILAEVTLNEDLRYGVQWFFNSKANSVELSAVDAGIASLFPGFSYIYSGGQDVRIILNALQSKTDVRVISAPKLSVLNNHKATLQVGDQVPILTQTSQSTISPGAPIVSSIQMRDTGVILDIKPRINENGSLILDVSQEVSDVAKTVTSGINSPTIQKRKIQTSVLTNDGFTVALGGLIRDNISQSNSGVPFIKDLPILGNLFRDNSSGNKRTELIVLLVPHIMRNQEETQSVVDSIVGELDSVAKTVDRVLPFIPTAKP